MRNRQLELLLTSAVEALGFEYVGYEYLPGARGVLRIYIDSSHGVTVEDCAKVSGQVNAVLAVEDPLQGNYFLEVSSPGLERPLFTLPHYARFVGQRVAIRLRIAKEGRRNFKGVLQAVEGSTIFLQFENELIPLDYMNIEKAHLLVDV